MSSSLVQNTKNEQNIKSSKLLKSDQKYVFIMQHLGICEHGSIFLPVIHSEIFSKPYSMCCLPDMARLLTHHLTAAMITCTGPSQDQASLILA